MKSQLTISGHVKFSTYSGMYTKGYTGTDYAKQIKGGAEPDKVENGKNAVVQAWANNLASALVNQGYAWGTAGSQLCFESNYGRLCTAANLSSTFGVDQQTSGLDPPKSAIGMKSSANHYNMLDMDSAVVNDTNSSSKATAYWYGIDVTTAIFYLGLLQTFTRATNGAIVWRRLIAQKSQVITLFSKDVTRVEWTLSLAT